MPPNSGATIVRTRSCVPPAHESEQAVNGVQVLMAQSTGQPCVLQVCVSVECGHAAPPALGPVCARLRDCEPVPHEAVHVDQAPKSPTTQSVAHAAVLQLRVSARYGHT